jgi:hypothetical protein
MIQADPSPRRAVRTRLELDRCLSLRYAERWVATAYQHPDPLQGSADRKERVERLGRLGLHTRQHVGVRVERDPDAGMPKAFGDDLRMHPLQQHEGGVAVAEIVEPDVGEPRAPQELRPRGGEGRRADRSSVTDVATSSVACHFEARAARLRS